MSWRSSLKLMERHMLLKDSNTRLAIKLNKARNKQQQNEKLVV